MSIASMLILSFTILIIRFLRYPLKYLETNYAVRQSAVLFTLSSHTKNNYEIHKILSRANNDVISTVRITSL